MNEIALDVADFTANSLTSFNFLAIPVISRLWKQRPGKLLRKGDKYLQDTLVQIDDTKDYMDIQLHREYHTQYKALFKKGQLLYEIPGVPNRYQYAAIREYKHDAKALQKRMSISSQIARSDNIWAKLHMSESVHNAFVIHEDVDNETSAAADGTPDGVDITEQRRSLAPGRLTGNHPFTVNIPLMDVEPSATHDADSIQDNGSVLQYRPMQTDDAV